MQVFPLHFTKFLTHNFKEIYAIDNYHFVYDLKFRKKNNQEMIWKKKNEHDLRINTVRNFFTTH